MRSIRMSAVVALIAGLTGFAVVLLGLALLLADAPSAHGAPEAVASGTARSALTWTSASVETSTDNPAGQCDDSDWHIGAQTGPLVCTSGGAPESAFAEALARLGWSNRVKVDAVGSQATATVDVQGPDPATLPDILPAGSTFTVNVQATDVTQTPSARLRVVLTLFERPEPTSLEEALGPVNILARKSLDLTESSVPLVLNLSADKDEVGLELFAEAITPVGGTFQLLTADSDSPVRTAGSGSTAGPYVVIASGAAAAMVAFAAGGWYARRRWLS